MEDRFKDDRPIELTSETHCCLSVVIDVSDSMAPHIDDVSKAVNRMMREIRQDERLSKILDMSIITFSDKGAEKMIQPFEAISTIPDISLTTGTLTYAADALKLARASVSKRKARYQAGCYKPWIVFITDGNIHDDLTDIGKELKIDEAAGKYHVLCFGVGKAYSAQQLFLLSDKCFQINNYDFKEFFSWIGNSQAVISVSASNANATMPATSSVCQLSISV
jgi:uncharacterized protein YegL